MAQSLVSPRHLVVLNELAERVFKVATTEDQEVIDESTAGNPGTMTHLLVAGSLLARPWVRRREFLDRTSRDDDAGATISVLVSLLAEGECWLPELVAD